MMRYAGSDHLKDAKSCVINIMLISLSMVMKWSAMIFGWVGGAIINKEGVLGSG